MNPAAVIFRDAIRNMPYRLRDQGVAALEIWGIRFLISLCSTVIGAASMMPAGSFAQRILAIAGLLIFSAILGMVVVPYPAILPVNPANRNRGIDSFTNLECVLFYVVMCTNICFCYLHKENFIVRLCSRSPPTILIDALLRTHSLLPLAAAAADAELFKYQI